MRLATCPLSHGCRRASVSAAASGAVCQWQTSSTDRRGSGDRPLGNVPPGRSGPEGGAKYVRRHKACAKPSLASPFGGRWCPVGTVQRLTEPAGESAPAGGGEGQPTPCAHVRFSLAQARRSAAAPRRDLRAQALGPRGRRWENGGVGRKPRLHAGLATPPGEGVARENSGAFF